MEKNEIERAILGYMVNHPQARDTIEGIARWWILRQRINLEIARVVDVVDRLVSANFLVEKKLADSTKVYCLNKDKLEEIETLLH